MDSQKIILPLRLFLSGAIFGAVGCVLQPYPIPAALLFGGCALLWLLGCFFAREARGEFRSAVKFILAMGTLLVVCSLLGSRSPAGILALGCGATVYFSISLLSSGCQAVQENRAPDDRVSPPQISTWFEYCAGIFALARAAGAVAPDYSFLAELCAMGSLLIGFCLLARFFASILHQQAPGEPPLCQK